jgi:hypothetical protein
MLMKKSLYIAMAMTSCLAWGQQTVDFEELTFPEGQNYWNGSDESGMFQSQLVTFSNAFNSEWGSWSGFAYSKETDNATAGWSNQYSAYPGSGKASSQYAVWNQNGTITFEEPVQVESISITNTTYTALSMRDGDQFAKQFGSPLNAAGQEDGTNGEDWLLLTISGWDSDNELTGTVEFYLADFRFEDNLEDYIIDTWVDINLEELGYIQKLSFSLSSTDNGEWGMNTPNYFALDDVVYQPAASASFAKLNKNKIKVYPNPAREYFMISDLDSDSQDAVLTALTGQVVKTFESLSNGQKLDVSDVPAGIYFVQISGKSERLVIR